VIVPPLVAHRKDDAGDLHHQGKPRLLLPGILFAFAPGDLATAHRAADGNTREQFLASRGNAWSPIRKKDAHAANLEQAIAHVTHEFRFAAGRTPEVEAALP